MKIFQSNLLKAKVDCRESWCHDSNPVSNELLSLSFGVLEENYNLLVFQQNVGPFCSGRKKKEIKKGKKKTRKGRKKRKLQLTGVSTERGSLLFRKKDRIPRPPENCCLQMIIIVLFNAPQLSLQLKIIAKTKIKLSHYIQEENQAEKDGSSLPCLQ